MSIKKDGETSYKETSFGIIPRSKLILLEIEGIKRAWDFILMEHKKGDLPITSKFFKEIHAVGFQWIFPKMGGQFRKIDVVVSAHNPPKFYLVPQLMEDLARDIKMRIQYLPATNALKFLDRLIEFSCMDASQIFMDTPISRLQRKNWTIINQYNTFKFKLASD